MEFRFRGNYQTTSAPHTFSDQATREAIQRKIERERIRGGILAEEPASHNFSDQATREAIQRELEKERIRAEILAEELARRRALEEEVRREIIMEREMLLQSGRVPSAAITVGTPISRDTWFEPGVAPPRGQPLVVERRTTTPLEGSYGGGGPLRREIRGLEPVSFQRLSPAAEVAKKEVIDLGKLNTAALSGSKRKSPPPPSPPSPPSPTGSTSSKKKTEEWKCAVCQLSTTSEASLKEHLFGKKHLTKMAALNKQEYKKEKPVGEATFWCELCQVGAKSSVVMDSHMKGKKHTKNIRLRKKPNGQAASKAKNNE